MNWVCPMAPAQEPTSFSGRTAPSCSMRSAAISSLVQKGARRASAMASVASERTTLREPISVP